MNLIILLRLLSQISKGLLPRNLHVIPLLLLSIGTASLSVGQRVCVDVAPVVNAGVLNETESAASLPDIIIIPVVVHIVYHDAVQNISDEQVRSQIAVLNNDFRKKNKDASLVPDAFKSLAA